MRESKVRGEGERRFGTFSLRLQEEHSEEFLQVCPLERKPRVNRTSRTLNLRH